MGAKSEGRGDRRHRLHRRGRIGPASAGRRVDAGTRAVRLNFWTFPRSPSTFSATSLSGGCCLMPTSSEIKRALREAGIEIYRTRGSIVHIAERVRENLIMDAGVRIDESLRVTFYVRAER